MSGRPGQASTINWTFLFIPRVLGKLLNPSDKAYEAGQLQYSNWQSPPSCEIMAVDLCNCIYDIYKFRAKMRTHSGPLPIFFIRQRHSVFIGTVVVILTVFSHSQVSLGHWLEVMNKLMPWSWVSNLLPCCKAFWHSKSSRQSCSVPPECLLFHKKCAISWEKARQTVKWCTRCISFQPFMHEVCIPMIFGWWMLLLSPPLGKYDLYIFIPILILFIPLLTQGRLQNILQLTASLHLHQAQCSVY